MRQPLPELRRAIDPRLEWVHDKILGPARNQQVEAYWAITWWIRSGGATVTTQRGAWQTGPGDWVFLLPGRRFQAFLPGTRMWSIGYRFARPRGSSWYIGPDALVLRDCPGLERAGRLLMARCGRAARQRPLGDRFDFACSPDEWLGIDSAFRGWLAAAVTTLSERGAQLAVWGREDERVHRALIQLDRDPWGGDSEPAALAALVGLSRRRLEQLFSRALGHGIGEARDRRRLEAAQDQLGRQEQPVKRIASRLGFSSCTAFSAWFRRHAGMSPRTFRSGVRPMT